MPGLEKYQTCAEVFVPYPGSQLLGLSQISSSFIIGQLLSVLKVGGICLYYSLESRKYSELRQWLIQRQHL